MAYETFGFENADAVVIPYGMTIGDCPVKLTIRERRSGLSTFLSLLFAGLTIYAIVKSASAAPKSAAPKAAAPQVVLKAEPVAAQTVAEPATQQ